jgi:glycosyltransferase involved in cell wall biosynthesis
MTPIVFLYQRMLPYHRARFRAVSGLFAGNSLNCIAIQVTDHDRSYGDIDLLDPSPDAANLTIQTLFPGQDYLDLKPRSVAGAVTEALTTLSPDTVFSPAPAFAEGAGALHFKARHPCRLILMDDAWSVTDRRGRLNRFVKRYLYGLFDGAFLPSSLHGDYFLGLNIPSERQKFPVDVVDDTPSPSVNRAESMYGSLAPYLLFVGRCVSRKRLDVLLQALANPELSLFKLVVIGDGPEAPHWRERVESLGLINRVEWLGSLPNDQVRTWMRGALALVVPSDFEQWGLVVNEAWQAGTLVLGSDSVGALRASYPPEWAWMLVPPGDYNGWRLALVRLLAMSPGERALMLERISLLTQRFNLAAHANAALQLSGLTLRTRPSVLASCMALAWSGRVAVY